MVAGAACDPGRPGLGGQRWLLGAWGRQPSEPIGNSSQDRCRPEHGTAQDPMWTQSQELVLGVPGRDTRPVVQLGAAYQEQGGGAIGEGEEAGHVPAGAAAGRQVPRVLVLLVLQDRAGRDGLSPGPPPPSCTPALCLSLSPETSGGALEMARKETPGVLLCQVGRPSSCLPSASLTALLRPSPSAPRDGIAAN